MSFFDSIEFLYFRRLIFSLLSTMILVAFVASMTFEAVGIPSSDYGKYMNYENMQFRTIGYFIIAITLFDVILFYFENKQNKNL